MREEDLLLDSRLQAQFRASGKKVCYGTAGFRELAVNMPYLVFRTGVFTAVLNKTEPSQCLGIVISASHNKPEDNGLKVTNFKGSVLGLKYQQQMEAFVEEDSLEVAVKKFEAFLVQQQKSVYPVKVFVIIGGDTRPSTKPLLQLLEKGIRANGGVVLNFGLTTTPQLHYYVYKHNLILKPKDPYKELTVEEIRNSYWDDIIKNFIYSAEYMSWNNCEKRTIDFANGVGAKIFPQFTKKIEKYLSIESINHLKDQLLNDKCGADFIKTTKKFPSEYESREHNSFVSFDGDSDRIVFFIQKDKQLMLIDGDRIGTVLTQFFNKIVEELALKTKQLNDSQVGIYLNIPLKPSIGFVQTYYANSASSDYLLHKYKMEPVWAATGVKYLHQKAQQYDIGIYFEANGHGTVIFKQNYIQRLEAILQNRDQLVNSDYIAKTPQNILSLQRFFVYLQFFVSVCKVCNPVVGDAIASFFLFELALRYLKMEYRDTLALYSDCESLTSKIHVRNKQACRVTAIEDKVIEPKGVQEQIEAVLAKHNGRKAFLRQSGTEDLLRLHVEADTKEQVGRITQEITQIVLKTPQFS